MAWQQATYDLLAGLEVILKDGRHEIVSSHVEALNCCSGRQESQRG